MRQNLGKKEIVTKISEGEIWEGQIIWKRMFNKKNSVTPRTGL